MTNFTAFTSAKTNPDFSEVQDIDPKDLWENRDRVAIIDVRRQDERQNGFIPGSVNIVLDTLPDNLDQIPKDRSLVFVCAIGGRSVRAATWALSEGYESVYNLKGGMKNWQQLNMEVTK